VQAFSTTELAALKTMLARGLNSPRTSSVGRLFDAVASLAGLRQQARFEGQTAMELEFALERFSSEESYELQLLNASTPALSPEPGHAVSGGLAAAPGASVGEMASAPSTRVLDWAPLLRSILSDISANVSVARISAKFHNSLAEAILAVARQAGLKRVVLSGGCFQNRYLTERAIHRLEEEGFQPYWHQRVPPNDGGIALGQVLACVKRKT
jgi:hydrogenase maturation protein HypF